MERYITVHYSPNFKTNNSSIFVANIENTKEKREIVNSLYFDKEIWFIEYHDYKHAMDWVIKG